MIENAYIESGLLVRGTIRNLLNYYVHFYDNFSYKEQKGWFSSIFFISGNKNILDMLHSHLEIYSKGI